MPSQITTKLSIHNNLQLAASVQTLRSGHVMGLVVASIPAEARAYNRVRVRGWVALLTAFSNRGNLTLRTRAHNMSPTGLMVKSLRPLPVGSIVYIRSQQLHFLAGWARVRHCRWAGWMYRIGLEFRKPLFTRFCDWREDVDKVAPADEAEPVGLAVEPGHGAAQPDVVCVPECEAITDAKITLKVIGSADLQDAATHFDSARAAKQSRAAIVGKLIEELNVLKPQMSPDDEKYRCLSELHPDFLTFKITHLRPEMKRKVLAVQNSSKHVRLAQELAAVYYGKTVATIQDDWKRCKPACFKRVR